MKPSLSDVSPSPLRPLLALALCAFAIGMAEFVIMGILPEIAADLSVSIANTGFLVTGYSLGVALAAPFVIMLTSRLSRKKLLVLLMLLFVLGNALAAAASGFVMLMTARILASLTHGSFFGVAAVVAAGMVRTEKRAWAVSMIVSGASVANIAGVPFGTFIGHAFGWRFTFVAVTAVGAAALIGIARLLPGNRNIPPHSLRRELGALGKPQVVLSLLVSAVCFGGVFMTFTYMAPILEQITSFSPQSVSWILVLFGIGVTLGNYGGGRLADWRLNPALMGITAGLAVCLFMFSAAAGSKPAAVVEVFLLGVFSFGILPCLTVYVMNKAMEAPNLVTTMNVSALHISNALGAWLGGIVIESRFGLPMVPMFASLVTMLGMMLMAFSIALDSKRKKKDILISD
ncbi:MFS transporter [Paenibacillus sp. Soil522]|uniref:MFS transporter n=1 Tax=Paenibacillus sp. Soil522 TaxID=1736388 RepID=UPI0009D74A20|nr:MFS transporter [Paenibacillus sp. Soil522]